MSQKNKMKNNNNLKKGGKSRSSTAEETASLLKGHSVQMPELHCESWTNTSFNVEQYFSTTTNLFWEVDLGETEPSPDELD